MMEGTCSERHSACTTTPAGWMLLAAGILVQHLAAAATQLSPVDCLCGASTVLAAACRDKVVPMGQQNKQQSGLQECCVLSSTSQIWTCE
jgi:hypothetical protein